MKKLAAFLLAVACAAPASAQEQTRFETLYRAGKKLQGAADAGMTPVRFAELLEAFSTEVSIGQDRASTQVERDMVAAFVAARDAYSANLTIWKQHQNIASIFGEKSPCVGACEAAVKKYELAKLLPDHASDRPPTSKVTGPLWYSTDVMKAMWVVGDEALKIASDSYMGKKPTKP